MVKTGPVVLATSDVAAALNRAKSVRTKREIIETMHNILYEFHIRWPDVSCSSSSNATTIVVSTTFSCMFADDDGAVTIGRQIAMLNWDWPVLRVRVRLSQMADRK